MSATVPSGLESSRNELGPAPTREKIMQAALRQCEEVGLRLTTMEDVARRARVGRATLYRHFQSKDALVAAIILDEVARFFDALDSAVEGFARSDQRLVEGFAFALEYLRKHMLLHKLLRTEPETLLPYLLGESELIPAATEALAQRIHVHVPRGTTAWGDVRATAEVAVRLVLSLALSPRSVLGANDSDGARRLVRRHLLPGLHSGDGLPRGG